MNYSFQVKQSKRILGAILWSILVIFFASVSHIETIPIKDKLSTIEEANYSMTSSIDVMSYFERKAYERLLQSYHLRIVRTLVLAGAGVLGIFYTLRQRKIVIENDKLCVYSSFGIKPLESINKDKMSSIHIGYASGIRGLLSDRGLHIEEVNKYDSKEMTFVSLKYIEESDRLIKMIHELESESLRITRDSELLEKESEASLKKILLTAIKSYRKNYKIILLLSSIIVIFSFLQQYYGNTAVNLLTSIVSVYFSCRAMIALNHYLYQYYRHEKTSFDSSWVFGGEKYAPYIGASMLKNIGMIIVSLGVILINFSSLQTALKNVSLIVTVLGGVLIYSRLYLIPYIASILDGDMSYMAVNTLLWNKQKKSIFLIALISILPVLLVTSTIVLTQVDIEVSLKYIKIYGYCLLVLNFFMIPFEACCSMSILKSLPLRESDKKMEGMSYEENA